MGTSRAVFLAVSSALSLVGLGLAWGNNLENRRRGKKKIKSGIFRDILSQFESDLEFANPDNIEVFNREFQGILTRYIKANESQAQYINPMINKLRLSYQNNAPYKEQIKVIRTALTKLKQPIKQ